MMIIQIAYGVVVEGEEKPLKMTVIRHIHSQT